MAVLYVVLFALSAVYVVVETIVLLSGSSLVLLDQHVVFFALLYAIAYLLGSIFGIFKEKYAGKLWDTDVEMNPYIKLWRGLNLGAVAVIIFCMVNTVRGFVVYIVMTFNRLLFAFDSPILILQSLLILLSAAFFIFGFMGAKAVLMLLGRRNSTLKNIENMPIFEDIHSSIGDAEKIKVKDDRIVLCSKDNESAYIYKDYELENIYSFAADGNPSKYRNKKLELIALYFEAKYPEFVYESSFQKYFPSLLRRDDHSVTLKRK